MNAQVKIPDLAELVVIDEKDALATFTTPGALDPILAHVRRHIDAFRGDASTPEGRVEIKSMAFAVTKSKTALKGVGDRLAKEAKDLPKKIDAGRRKVEDTLDAWRDEVRKPLTDWETAEEARIKRHLDELDALKLIPTQPPGSAEQIRSAIVATEAVSDGADREEFRDGFQLAKRLALQALRERLQWREQNDSEQAELAKHRAEAEAREAEDRKRREIEAKAAEAKRIADGIVEAAAIAADNARRDAERQAQLERDRAAAREAELKAQADAADLRAAQAEAKARADALAEAKRLEDEAKARERDKANRARVNNAALEAFVAGGIAPEVAKAVITLIAKREIPRVQITY